jgi:hypothetical protein
MLEKLRRSAALVPPIFTNWVLVETPLAVSLALKTAALTTTDVAMARGAVYFREVAVSSGLAVPAAEGAIKT